MKKIQFLIATIMIAIFMSGCGAAKISPQQQSVIDNHTVLYTQRSMWIDTNRVYGTNFSKALHVPINSPVKIVSLNAKRIIFEFLGAPVTYYVTTKHTRLDTAQTLDRMFLTKKVDLSKFSASTKKNIMAGKVVKGMSKEAVLLSRGYPPMHQTLSLKANSWKYWYHRFKTSSITFKNNKVVSLEGGVF